MGFLFLLIGALCGAWTCGLLFDNQAWGAGLLFGAISGLFIARWRKLGTRVAQLEQQLALLRQTVPNNATDLPQRESIDTPGSPPIAQSMELPEIAKDEAARISTEANAIERRAEAARRAREAIPTDAALAGLRAEQTAAADDEQRADGSANEVSASIASATAESIAPVRREPDALARAVAAITRWFTEGNVPVKIGVLVLFAGVAALIKYAADQGWLTLPIELRLAGIAAVAIAALVFAWRKREQHRGFALSLQGGAIGILLLLVFSAFRLYQLIPSGAAFALLLILIAGTGMLAVLQDALALAVLGIIGGFLAPILVASGDGSHVVLFSYYALLNAAILGIAWRKPWRILNLIGFAFTFGIGIGWGVLRYRPENLASTLPFLLLFWLFYLAIPILYARRQTPDRRARIDATLVFGTPLLAFPLLAALLPGERLTLAFGALLAAGVYTALAWLLLRRMALTLLGESHALLALGFATLAVPLAFSARSTACAWALEGVALVWLGLRQQRRLPRWIGYGLQLAAAVAFALHLETGFDAAHETWPIFNGTFFGALLISLAALLSARLLSLAEPKAPLSHILFGWGLLWWYGLSGHEIQRFAPADTQIVASLGLIALIGWIGAELLRRLQWRDCIVPAALIFVLALPLIVPVAIEQHAPLEGYAAPAWGVWLLAALRALACLDPALRRGTRPRSIDVLHFLFLWTLVLLLGAEFAHLAEVRFTLAPIWVALAALLPVAVLFLLVLQRQRLAHYPLPSLSEPLRAALLTSLGAVLAIAMLLGLLVEGRATPLAYLPLLNPLELGQCLAALLLLRWYREARRAHSNLDNEAGVRLFALFGFALLTAITLRSVHFLGGVPWSARMFDATVTQASLSLVWSAAGIAAMLIGARRAVRGVWIGGAALMGVVLLKLILIDRQHLGDLPGIVSFLAVGVLLLVVGYFAPVPPRKSVAADGAPA